ncbi:hypothetical protein EJB05_55608, partial [Eragrostis curvula]
MSVWNNPWEKRMHITKLVLASIVLPSIMVAAMVFSIANKARFATEFSMELAGFEGFNSTLGHMVSPAFSLKVHVENHRFLQPHSWWCYHGGEAVVSYSDVALAWGHVPRFCMKRRVPAELNVLAWARGVGVPEDLLRRLELERRIGTAQILVQLKLFYDDGLTSAYRNQPSPSFKLLLKGDEHP